MPLKLLKPNSPRMKTRIKPIAQAIPQQIQTQGRERDCGSGKKREVSSDAEKVAAVCHHGSPLRKWWLSAESQKAEPRRRQHHIAGSERSLYQNRRCGISQDVMEQDAPRSRSQSASGLHVLDLFEGEGQIPRKSGVHRNRKDGDGHQAIEKPRPENRNDQDRQYDSRERIEKVDQP